MLKEKRKSNLRSNKSFKDLALLLIISVVIITSIFLVVFIYYPEFSSIAKNTLLIALALSILSSLRADKEKLKSDFETEYGWNLISRFDLGFEFGNIFMNKALREYTEGKIKQFIDNSKDEKLVKSILERNIRDFKEFGGLSYDELLKQIKTGNLQVTTTSVLDYTPLLMRLIASPKKLGRYKRQRTLWPVIGVAIIVFGIIWFNNYWLLLVFFTYPLTQLISGNYGFFKMIKDFILVVLLMFAGYAILNSNFQILCISIPIIIWLINFTTLRENYRDVIKNTALVSEIAFIFLFYFNYVEIFDFEKQKFIHLKHE